MLAEYVSTIGDHLPQILQKGIEIIGELLAGIVREVPNLIASIPGIIADIGSAFLDKDWAGIGWDIISGIGSGIANAAENLVDAAVSAAENAVNAVKGWLGIASPSKLMRDQVGKYMALGMGIGFEKNIPVDDMNAGLADSIQQMHRKAQIITQKPVVTTAQAAPALAGRGGAGYPPQPIDYDRLADTLAEVLDGTAVNMDGDKVGDLITPRVSRNVYLDTRRRR